MTIWIHFWKEKPAIRNPANGNSFCRILDVPPLVGWKLINNWWCVCNCRGCQWSAVAWKRRRRPARVAEARSSTATTYWPSRSPGTSTASSAPTASSLSTPNWRASPRTAAFTVKKIITGKTPFFLWFSSFITDWPFSLGEKCLFLVGSCFWSG